MAFALTSFFADGQQFNGPGLYRGYQSYVFTVTGLDTDVDFDLGDYAGTFWTDALADSTYGSLATSVLAQLERLDGNIQATKSVYTPELADRIQAASTSGTAYTLSLDADSFLPIYTFAASNGELTYTVFVEFLLQPNIQPANLTYNIG